VCEALNELKVHAAIEEKLFYPTVLKSIGKEIMNEADEEHHVAKLLIATRCDGWLREELRCEVHGPGGECSSPSLCRTLFEPKVSADAETFAFFMMRSFVRDLSPSNSTSRGAVQK
jgi:hypothetical protein